MKKTQLTALFLCCGLFIFASLYRAQRLRLPASETSTQLTQTDSVDVNFTVGNINRFTDPTNNLRGRNRNDQTSLIRGQMFVSPEGDANKPVSLAMHGFMSNDSVFIPVDLELINTGRVSRAYSINVPGQGAGSHRSLGAPGILNMVEHLYQVVEQIHAEVAPRKIILQGHSMGGLTNYLLLGGVRKLHSGEAIIDPARIARLREILAPDGHHMLWTPPLNWENIVHYESRFWSGFYSAADTFLHERRLRIPGIVRQAPNTPQEISGWFASLSARQKEWVVDALANWIKTYLPDNGIMFVSNMSLDEVKLMVTDGFTGSEIRFGSEFARMLNRRAMVFGEGARTVNIADITEFASRPTIISASRDELAAAAHNRTRTRALGLNHIIQMKCSHLDAVFGRACFAETIIRIFEIARQQEEEAARGEAYRAITKLITPAVVPFENQGLRNRVVNSCLNLLLQIPGRRFFTRASSN